MGEGHAVNGMRLHTVLQKFVFSLFTTSGSYVIIGLCFKMLLDFGHDLGELGVLKC